MFDPTMHRRTLVRHFVPQDFVKDRTLLTSANASAVVVKAVEIGLSGFNPVALRSSVLRGKTVYGLPSLPHNLVLRHITANIRRVTRLKQDDRQFMVRCIQRFVQEGTAFRVYKFDVRSFYESVQVDGILGGLGSDLAFSGQSVRALVSLFNELKNAGVEGLPRGMAISATLAEYVMRPFDGRMSNNLGVWYYSRFVDDILIITDGREDISEFSALASSLLPRGLHFNRKSSVHTFVAPQKHATNTVEHSFSFLGYLFSISYAHRGSENKTVRSIALDIAPNKVAKIKTRMAKALLKYKIDKNFIDLRDRIRLLTSNFNFVDRKTGVRRVSGIFFNYPLICSAKSSALSSLDDFLRRAVTASTPRNKLFPALSNAERQQILGLSFRRGFDSKRFFQYRPERLAFLSACWHYA